MIYLIAYTVRCVVATMLLALLCRFIASVFVVIIVYNVS